MYRPQCNSSYGFSVIVRVIVTGFIICQLESQLSNKMFFSYSSYFFPVTDIQLKLHMQLLE